MHRKGHRVTKRKVRKGGYYGFTGAVGTGAPAWGRGSEMGNYAISERGGNAQYGSSRRRTKKTKRSRRKHRGGSKYGAVSASFQGTGSRGMIDVHPVDTKGASPGSAANGAFNNFGAGPGSGHSNFVTAGSK
jgi:hypothetical protein